MRRFALALTVAAATSLLNGSLAHADLPFLGLLRDRPAAAQKPAPAPARDRPSQWDRQRPYDASWYQPEMYPKYYGGFHYRSFEIYDSPSGQRGMRGTAW
jgi:hypothetical protein